MNETAISLTDQHPSLDFRWAISASDLMLSPEQLQRTMEHYHFPKTEECEFLQLQKQIKEVVQCRGILLALPDNMRQEAAPYGKMVLHRQDTVLGAMTLGTEYDELQKAYTEKQQLSQSYRMEMLGMEYLRKAYALFNEAVSAEGLGYLGEYHYLEDSRQILQACNYLQSKQFTTIAYNRYGVLMPSKSVLFKAALKQEAGSGCVNTCASCTAFQCSFRSH